MTLSYADACRYLFPRTGGATEWSLGPTAAMLAALGNPEQQYPSIHIGGTNGKGSVAVLVAGALRAMGQRVALYTSPHLVEIRERMMVNDQPISHQAFAMWAERLVPVIERCDASFFEVTTAIAFADFAARGADIAVVEVGLGGRLDATNVLTPSVSAVTHVSREHTDYLGDDLAGIAREKAGIAKPDTPFILGERDRYLADVMERAAVAAGAHVVRVAADAEYEGNLRLAGRHQRRNAAIAEAVLAALPPPFRPSATALARGFHSAWLPGRFDRRGRWIFDVAHNPGAVEILAAALGGATPPRPIHVLAAFLRDKAWPSALAALGQAADGVWVTQPPSAPPARRWNLEDVASAAPVGTRIIPDFDAALQDVQQGAATVLVCGSFHTVGDAMARLPGFAPLG